MKIDRLSWTGKRDRLADGFVQQRDPDHWVDSFNRPDDVVGNGGIKGGVTGDGPKIKLLLHLGEVDYVDCVDGHRFLLPMVELRGYGDCHAVNCSDIIVDGSNLEYQNSSLIRREGWLPNIGIGQPNHRA